MSPPKQKTAVGQQHSVKISALHIKCTALNGMSFGTQIQFDFSSAVYRQTKRSVSFLNAEYGSKEKGLINTRKPLQTFQMPFHNSVSQLQPDLSCNYPLLPVCLPVMYVPSPSPTSFSLFCPFFLFTWWGVHLDRSQTLR